MGIVIRVAVVYVFVWGCFRIIGKRELTGMSPLEVVTLLLIPQLFSRALTGPDYSMTNGIIGASTLISLVFISSAVTHRSRAAARVMTATPTVLVEDGRFIEPHMNQERIAPFEIFAAMHRDGLAELNQVQWAVLQSDGKISVIPVSPQ